MQFICLFLLLASLYGLMILVQKWLSVSYTQIPFVTLTSLLSVLYVAGLFGLLWHVSHLVFLTGLGCFALRFYKWASCRHLADNNSLLPLAAFGVLYFISYFLWKNFTFSEWDEFGWGIYTKIITTHDSLIAGYNDIPGADYPRISAILQYYFISFLSGGDFDEGTAIFAQTIIFSSAAPVFFSFRKHNPLLLVLIACCFYCLFYLFVLPIYLIYNDSMLGLCWGMSVILYLINRNRDKAMLITTSICLFFMVQVKPIGIVFAFFTLFTVAIDEAFFSRVGPPAKLKKLGVLIAAVIVSWASWSAFKSYNGITPSPVTLSLEAIYDFLSDPQDYQRTTAENFLHSLIYTGGEQHTGGFIGRFAHPFAFSNFSLSPLGWAFVFAIFMFLCCLVGNTSRDVFRQRSRHIALTMSLTVVLLMYTCLLLFLYATAFYFWEAVRLASFGRYLGTAYLGIFLVLFFTVTKNKGLLFAFMVLIFLFTPFSVLKSSALRHKHIEDFYGKVDPVIEKLKRDSESKTLVIDQGGNRFIQTLFHYRAFPLNTSLQAWSSVHPEVRDDWGIWQGNFSAKQFGRQLREYDYLVVWNDTAFWERYGDTVKRSQLKAVWALNDDRLAKIDVDTIGVAASYRSIAAGDPIIRSDFDLYLDENVLSYLKVPCADADTEGRFFFKSYPEHLERGRYDDTAFSFFETGGRADDKCIARVVLPAYEIDSIRTGQWVPYKGVAWEATYHLSREDKALALFGVITSSEPMIDSVFDVYPHRDKLVYLKEPCLPADTQDPFYLHLIPADEHDLPADRRADGFDRYDFVFEQYGTHFDGKCMAFVPLPQYEIALIRTGQYVFDSEQRYISNWNREAVTRTGSEPKRSAVTPIMSPPVPPRLRWTTGGNGEVALQWWTESDLDRGTIEKHQYRQSTDGGTTWSNWTDIARIEEVHRLFYYLETGLIDGISKMGSNIPRLGFYYLVTGLTSGAEYAFQVRAENHAGTSGPSASRSTIPRAGVPKTVRDFAAAAGNGRATLTWTNPNDTTITGYQYDLRRPRSEGGWTSMQQIPGSDATTTSYTVTGLTNDSLYVFIMQVLNRNGGSPKTRRIPVIPTASKAVAHRAIAGDPIIRSDFDVYLDENRLSYLKVPCTDADTEGRFFFESYPEHIGRGRYDDTAFSFLETGGRFDDKCIAQVVLPAYEIDSIRTGQWAPYKGVAWEATYHLSREDKAPIVFRAIATREPMIDSVFDVYHHRDKLAYLKEPCLPADTQDPFYLHLIPVDEHDLPADRRADGFDRYDFVFEQYGTHFDGKCMAFVPLPQYEIALIRTGQYVFDSEQRYISNWNREAVTRAGSEPKRDVATPILSPPIPPRLRWTTGGNGEVALQWWTESDLDKGTIEKHQYRQSTDGGTTWSNWTDIAGIEEGRKRLYYLATGLTSGTSKTGFNILQRLGFYYLVTGLTNGAEYAFQVRAENHAGTSGPSASRSTIPRAGVPKTVRDFAAAAGNGRATLTWANPNNTTITGYQYDLRRPRSEGGWTSMQQIPDSDATTTSYTVTGLTNDSLYVFIMQVLNRNGGSPKSRRIPVIPTASE